jgi:hypothetical protein
MILGALTAESLVLMATAVMAHPATHLLDTHATGGPVAGHVDLGAVADGRFWAALGLMAGVALLRLAGRRARGRAIALGLALVLSIFTMESAVHSVHHLASPETASTCPVLSSAEHLGWGDTPMIASEVTPPRVTPAPAAASEPIPYSLPHRPRQGRAPPA